MVSVVSNQTLDASTSGTFTLVNGSSAGRAVIVIGTQYAGFRSLDTATFDGVNFTQVGTTQDDPTGECRVILGYWDDVSLPTTSGSYPIGTDHGPGTAVTFIELENADVSSIQTITGVGETTNPSPFNLTGGQSAFLGLGFTQSVADNPVSTSGDTEYFSDTRKLNIGRVDSGSGGDISIDGVAGGSRFTYMAFSVDATSLSPSLSAPVSASPGEIISFTATNFSGSINSVSLSDGTSTMNLTNIVNTSGDEYTAEVPSIPSVGASQQMTGFGSVTMTVGDGVDSAQDTTSLTVGSGFALTALAASFNTSETGYLFNFGGTPVEGDQFLESDENLVLHSDGGYVANTDGTYIITGIDLTDGIAQTYELVVGPDVQELLSTLVRKINLRKISAKSITARGIK